jgi:hypothetical protein
MLDQPFETVNQTVDNDGAAEPEQINCELARPLVERLVRLGRGIEGKWIVASYADVLEETDNPLEPRFVRKAIAIYQVENGDGAAKSIMAAFRMLAKTKPSNPYISPFLVRADLEEGKRGEEEDIVARFALVGDFDSHEGPAIDWAAMMPLSAHIAVASSPGNCQPWLFLDKGYPVAALKDIGLALVRMFNDEEGVVGDMTRIVRLPGGPNWPNKKKRKEGRRKEPHISGIAIDENWWLLDGRDDWHRGYTPDELRAAIPAKFFEETTEAPAGAKSEKSGGTSAGFDWNAQGREKTYNAFSFGDAHKHLSDFDGKWTDRSDGIAHFVTLCWRRGYTPEQVVELMLRCDAAKLMGHYEVDGEVSEQRVRDDVKRMFTKWGNEAPRHKPSALDSFRIVNSDDGEDDPATVPVREIRIVAGALGQNIDEAEQALIERKVGIFQRGTVLVRPVLGEIKTRSGELVEAPRLVRVRAPELIERFTSAAAFLKYLSTKDAWVSATCPREFAETYLAREGLWKLRRLNGIITAPTLRPDGSLLDRPGYDSVTGLMFDPCGVTFPAIPEHPTKANAVAALAVLKKLISTFPFKTDADRAVALAAMLTAPVRAVLDFAPAVAFTAPVRRSGKGKLTDIAAVIGTGSPALSLNQGASDEETEKRIGATMMAADGAVSIDNIVDPLDSALLCSMLTQRNHKVRVLGQSVMMTLPTNLSLYATGNNLRIVGDLVPRFLRCEIDPETERPELRPFSNDPVADALHDRPQLVAAALTIIRAGLLAKFERRSPLGSFEMWSRWVRDPLIWLDEADVVSTMTAGEADDPEREALAAVLYHWADVVGGERITAKKLISYAMEGNGSELGKDRKPGTALFDALHAVAASMVRSGSAIDGRRLGEYLKRHQDRWIDGRKVVKDGKRDGNQAWRLIVAK